MLDRLADETGASFRARAAAARAEAARARATNLALARWLGRKVAALMAGCPSPGTERDTREAWPAGAIELAADAQADVRRLLASRPRRRGNGDLAPRIPALIAPEAIASEDPLAASRPTWYPAGR